MISLKNITKNYYLSKTNVVNVLKGVSVDFRKHEFVSILGPSGCGKTTLLNVIGGLDVFESGDIVVDGVSTAQYKASDWDNYRNKRIGFVFQSYNLIPHLNVVRNVEMPLILTGVKKAECRKRAIEVLKLVGLEAHLYKRPLQLSGGQMQRVALARALITNPDIILADEPTGALDNEASEVVMSLLKKVAEDRLVIMVTHNDLLAKEYSTRIINLSGGVVAGDSDPYDPTTEESVNAAPEAPVVDAPVEAVAPADESGKKKKKRPKKSKLGFLTAIELSFKTLLSKKVRTSLTSFAGSIGIIGILLVLAFSQGVDGYIAGMEESSLAMYPLTIEEMQISIGTVLSKLTGAQNSDREDYPKDDTIYTNKVLGGILQDWMSLTATNDLPSFKTYLDENFDNNLGYVKYDYGVTLNVYAPDPKHVGERYMKVEPFTDVLHTALENLNFGGNSMINMVEMYAGNISSWQELMDNRELLHSQYDLIGASRWPRSEVYRDENGDWVTEVVMIADAKNQFNDYVLFMLGLLSEDDLGAIMSGDESLYEGRQWKASELIGKEYYILANSDYYSRATDEEGNPTDHWIQTERTEQGAAFVTSNYSIKAKVVGVIRPSRNSSGGAMYGAIGYDPSLTDFMIEHINGSEIVTAERATETLDEGTGRKSWTNLITGNPIRGQNDFDKLLTEMGVADTSKPNRILIYASSFDAKEKIIKFLDDYNDNAPEGKEIKYTDNLSTIMGFVTRMSDVIKKVLIGFTSVSLIVSSIMISVIIYTSVLERRKEVGILRSVGARKRDIVMIFMAESGILGLYSGILGALIAWLITLPVNAILAAAVGINNLADLTWYSALPMIGVSFLLSVVAGVVPAFIGAKQDPAVALRTE